MEKVNRFFLGKKECPRCKDWVRTTYDAHPNEYLADVVCRECGHIFETVDDSPII